MLMSVSVSVFSRVTVPVAVWACVSVFVCNYACGCASGFGCG